MMVGELVLPEVMVGITEASTTRMPIEAEHAQPLVDHRQRIAVAAHLGGADRMEDRGADVAPAALTRAASSSPTDSPGRYSTG